MSSEDVAGHVIALRDDAAGRLIAEAAEGDPGEGPEELRLLRARATKELYEACRAAREAGVLSGQPDILRALERVDSLL
jgi:hypothetical protein